MIDGDGELQLSGNFQDISVPFIPRNAKSLPSSPVKPHEAVPLSEYGGRTEKEEVAPEVVQSWRRETFLDTDINHVMSVISLLMCDDLSCDQVAVAWSCALTRFGVWL